jgi:Uma2 family endonuclease
MISKGANMTTLILDDFAEARVLADRRAKGLDRFDEVWDGVYIMAPAADNEHQRLSTAFSTVLEIICREFGAKVYNVCNVTDREDDWTKNYRCPDIAIYFPTNPAKDMQTYWFGGPDFAVEVVSKKDQTWEKLNFYADVQTREVLIIDRDPWKLSLLRLANKQLDVVATATIEDPLITSEVIPATFRLVERPEKKPLIEVRHTRDDRTWLVDPA